MKMPKDEAQNNGIVKMIRPFLCFLLLLGLSKAGFASPRPLDRLFAEAQSAFELADTLPATDNDAKTEAFRRVAVLYQGMIDRGVRSGAVYYNQGNAWTRAGEPGRAIAAYLTAKRYLPLDPYLDANLRSVAGAGFKESKPMIESVLFWQNLVGYPQKLRWTLILGVLTFLLATTLLFRPRRLLRRVTLLMVVLSLVMTVSAIYDWYRFDYLSHAVVAIEQAMPRKGNSLQYEPAFTAPLALGTVGVVTGQRGDWVQLRFDTGKDAWLPKEQVVVF